MGRLENFLSTCAAGSSSDLLLCHSAACNIAFKIIDALKLSPTKCKVYDELLAYLFYGRPAYKSLPGIAASTVPDHYPVCFLFDASILTKCVRQLPFDSGGYSKYAPYIAAGLERTDFELSGDHSLPAKIVKAFFETPRGYYYQRPHPSPSIPASQGEAASYMRLIKAEDISPDDDRRGTIEVQVDQEIPLIDFLRVLIVPTAIAADPVVLKLLTVAPGVELKTYEVFGRATPAELNYPLYFETAKYYSDRGLI